MKLEEKYIEFAVISLKQFMTRFEIFNALILEYLVWMGQCL